jgi:hypothetical protein
MHMERRWPPSGPQVDVPEAGVEAEVVEDS